MKSGWSPERKAKQRKAIYAWRPWERSTGPKTLEGKQAVASNAFKHGMRSRAMMTERRSYRRLLQVISDNFGTAE
jgi:hypothetical protein